MPDKLDRCNFPDDKSIFAVRFLFVETIQRIPKEGMGIGDRKVINISNDRNLRSGLLFGG